VKITGGKARNFTNSYKTPIPIYAIITEPLNNQPFNAILIILLGFYVSSPFPMNP
jgi:hypothetical protein